MSEEHANLPAVPADDELADVVDGVIVDNEDRAPGAPPPPPVRAVTVVQVINVAVQHPVARHALYVPGGLVALARGWKRRRTLATALAEQAGTANGPLALQFLQQAELERKGRAERRAQDVGMLKDLVSLWKPVLAIWVFLMVMTGIALAYDHHSPGYLLWPWKTLFTLVADVVAIWTVAVWVLSFGIPLGFIAWLHHLGRTAGLAPKWAATSADSDVDTVIDEAAITQALKQLRIPQVTDYLKLGQPMPYIVPCRQEGRGTYCEIRLPGGLPALEIAKQVRRERLAASLFRHTKEVWPTTGADNSHLKLWIADKGALEEGAGPYPLLGDGVTDVFKGVPFGRTLRGDPVMAPLMERNTITGGMPGQGKSSAARVIMCGAALDPRAELWIMIPDINFDFELMKRRCSRYVMGAEDEHVQVIRDWLADLRDEVQARGQLLVDHEIPAVTPKLASARMGLHPLVVLLEEAHVAIQHAVYGKEISQLLIDVVKLGRKRGIHVIVSTQAPTKDSMPRDVTRNCSNGIAFAVGDHVPNDALLGAGAYRAGHRATELIPGTDRGVAVVKGFSGERSEMVQVYFLSVDDPDQVTPLMERAMAEVMKRGGLPGPVPPVLAIEARSLLDDLATVLAARSGKVRLSDIPVLLRDLAPSWRPYQGLNGTRLRELLLAEGVRTTNARNVPELDPADLREVLGRRDGEVS